MKKIIIITLLLTTISVGCFAKDADKRSVEFRKKVSECPKQMIKKDDGDSIFCGDEYIRILGFDTPETIHEEHGIFENQELGPESKKYASKLIDAAKSVVIIRSKADKYGRTLAHVLLDGELLAVKMIKAGFAYESVSHYGDSGFPEFALQIKEAAKSMPTPKFESPHKWRQKHQKKDLTKK